MSIEIQTLQNIISFVNIDIGDVDCWEFGFEEVC